MRDSSLSASTQAVVAAEVGHLSSRTPTCGSAALIDLDDLDSNTHQGLHLAALAGTLDRDGCRIRRPARPRRRGSRLARAGPPRSPASGSGS